MSNSSLSTRLVGRVLWEELLKGEGENMSVKLLSHITYYSLIMFFIAYTFKGQVLVFAGRVKIESHFSCKIRAILGSAVAQW